MQKSHIAAVLATFFISSAVPAAADPTFGIGLTLTFGANQEVNTGIGVRIFSDDRSDRAAASLGVDYMFRTKTVRGAFGVAYLKDNAYVELTGGYHFASQNWDFGIGLGGTDTDDPTPAAAPVGPPIAPPVSPPVSPPGVGTDGSSPPGGGVT
jgi:hypothetical protein